MILWADRVLPVCIQDMYAVHVKAFILPVYIAFLGLTFDNTETEFGVDRIIECRGFMTLN